MNKKDEKFSIKKRLKSFIYAWNGLKVLIREEHNARIHLVVSFFVIVFGFVFHISLFEWIAICFAMGFVISTEILNSAIENLANYVSPQYHDLIKKVKDLGAAAVLVSTISAIIVGFIIFIPRILVLID
jgi:diacylglycerol kinase